MEIFSKILFFIVIMPVIIFKEGSEMLANFLKKKNIYTHWDIWHSILLVLIILLIILWMSGFTPTRPPP
ncbi:MAG: hypothetical protein WAN61_02540 [Minisyncoccia bacterium]